MLIVRNKEYNFGEFGAFIALAIHNFFNCCIMNIISRYLVIAGYIQATLFKVLLPQEHIHVYLS